MIAIAARATRGVAIPNRKQTRAQIIASFKKQMKALQARLNVWVYNLVLDASFSQKRTES